MLAWMKHKLGIKIARRNINNLRYADDTTLMAESKEELKSFLTQKLRLRMAQEQSWVKSISPGQMEARDIVLASE